MQTYDLVKAALKDKNPALYKSLAASGELNQFVTERADETDSEIVTLTMELSNKARMAAADPMEVSQILKGYESIATETVLACFGILFNFAFPSNLPGTYTPSLGRRNFGGSSIQSPRNRTRHYSHAVFRSCRNRSFR